MRFSRNIGLITHNAQKALSNAHIAICGVGGMGGVAAEALARMGVGRMTILDKDRFELSNMNRQIHCTEKTLGMHKVDAVEQRLLEINPSLEIKKFYEINIDNAATLLTGVDLIVNGMDEILASIILERQARAAGITIVDAWITPFASVFVMKPDSPHWEEFLKFPTKDKEISAITPEDLQRCLQLEVAFTLKQFDPFRFVSARQVKQILSGEIPRPSMVPVVWMSGVLMANEVMKILTGQGQLATHWGVFYNQYDHEIRYLEYNGKVRYEEFSDYRAAG